MPVDQRSLIHQEVWFPPCFVRQNHQKKTSSFLPILDHFQSKIFKSETTSIHYLSPKDSDSLKNIGHPTLKNWGTKT